MKQYCSRSACGVPLENEGHYAIWNEPSTEQPRLYCLRCGKKIIQFNEQDTLKLKYEIRNLPDLKLYKG
jgi:hypothetical protein